MGISAYIIDYFCMVDMIWIEFLLLFRPGEYMSEAEGSRPFFFQDTDLYVGCHRLDSHSLAKPDHNIMEATYAFLTFSKQNNYKPGEVVAQLSSGTDRICAVCSIGQ